MNRLERLTAPMMSLLALGLAALAAGCGSDNASSAKAITAYSLSGATGTIDETAKAISVSLPFGTNVTALVATFTTTGTGVEVGTTVQVSGATANNFTSPVQYIVSAADGSTATYTVTAKVAPSTAKAITTYALAGASGTINEASKTVAVTVPFGTNVTALVATFTTTGVSVKVGSTAQVSGTTPNNFTNPVQYIVAAADTSTATYAVTVTVAANPAKAITAFSIAGGFTGTVNEAAKTISVPVPAGTILTSMIATFTTTGTSVKVGTTTQVSGTTQNDFTNPVQYVVTAADTTTATYTVRVNVAGVPAICAGTGCVDLGKAANFAILTKAGITDVPASPITGNIGTSSITGASITVPCTDVLTGQVFTDDANFPGSTCTSTDKLGAALAVSDMQTAYTAASNMLPAGGGLTTACPGVGAFSDATSGPLAAGVYKCAVNVTIPGGLTLNGNATAVWVFQITGKLTQASATIVHLTGGALPQNVFWQVSDVVEIGTTAHMEGVILAQTAINARTGSTVKGRLLAQTAVTLDTATVTQP